MSDLETKLRALTVGCDVFDLDALVRTAAALALDEAADIAGWMCGGAPDDTGPAIEAELSKRAAALRGGGR